MLKTSLTPNAPEIYFISFFSLLFRKNLRFDLSAGNDLIHNLCLKFIIIFSNISHSIYISENYTSSEGY